MSSEAVTSNGARQEQAPPPQPSQQLFSFSDTEFMGDGPMLQDASSETLTKTSLHSIGFKTSNYAMCPICGDKISGNHYGVNTCESCKGFFKRTKKSTSELKCVTGSNACPMSIDGRKLCAKCRYDKCLAVGMSEGAKSRIVISKASGQEAPARASTRAPTDDEEEADGPLYLPSLAATRTRTIKRRFVDYDDDDLNASAPLAKRAPGDPDMKKSDHTVVTLDLDQPAAKETTGEAPRGEECQYCFRSLDNLNAYNKRTHLDHCKFRDRTSCIYCMVSMAGMGQEQRRTHINECRVEHNNQVHKDARDERPSLKKKEKRPAKTKAVEETEEVSELEAAEEQEDESMERSNGDEEEDDADAAEGVESTLSATRPPSSRIKAKRSLETAQPSPELETPRASRQPARNSATPSNSATTASGFVKCRGYQPDVSFAAGSVYSNFPFQAIDFDGENIKFVMENGVFHNHNCAKRDYRLMSDSRDKCNRYCSDLMYNKYLQNIMKRSQAKDNFSSVPHIYLTFNQLKKELNHYRESIKKLKLDNLNLKRTIESLRSKEEN